MHAKSKTLLTSCMHEPEHNQSTAPLYIVLANVLGVWVIANAGFFLVFPAFGYAPDYNAAPVVFALYFLACSGIAVFIFKDLFYSLIPSRAQIWTDGILSLSCAAIIWAFLYVFSLTPQLRGPLLAPYSDILFANLWYFLPKSADILVQQILIAALVYALAARFRTLKKILVAYFVTFGGTHILMFAAGVPTAYAAIMTSGAVFSTFVFPYLILRVRGGFIIAYTLHLLFYIVVATALHTWPPPSYVASVL